MFHVQRRVAAPPAGGGDWGFLAQGANQLTEGYMTNQAIVAAESFGTPPWDAATAALTHPGAGKYALIVMGHLQNGPGWGQYWSQLRVLDAVGGGLASAAPYNTAPRHAASYANHAHANWHQTLVGAIVGNSDAFVTRFLVDDSNFVGGSDYAGISAIALPDDHVFHGTLINSSQNQIRLNPNNIVHDPRGLWDAANQRLLIPPGGAGIYLFMHAQAYSNYTFSPKSEMFRIGNTRTSTNIHGWPISGNWGNGYWQPVLRQMAEGDYIWCEGWNAGAWYTNWGMTGLIACRVATAGQGAYFSAHSDNDTTDDDPGTASPSPNYNNRTMSRLFLNHNGTYTGNRIWTPNIPGYYMVFAYGVPDSDTEFGLRVQRNGTTVLNSYCKLNANGNPVAGNMRLVRIGAGQSIDLSGRGGDFLNTDQRIQWGAFLVKEAA